MESDAAMALIENLKMINQSLDKITSRIDALEKDYQERSLLKRFLKWLIAFYPLIIILLVILIDSDHHKIAEVASDVRELIKDTQSITYLVENDNSYNASSLEPEQKTLST